MTAPEQMRLDHYAAAQQAREAAVPAPSPQGHPESHDEAMTSAHEGRPTVAAQQQREMWP